MNLKNKLALFDLDGTLFDTSEVNFKAYQHALNDLGYDLDHDYFVSECNGKHYKEFLNKIVNSIDDIEKVHENKLKYYSQHLDYARINKHLFNLINIIKKEYYVVIVTTASLKNTSDILNAFKVREIFDDIITPNDYKKLKPDPESFNLSMKRFNINKEDTIIFEDSDVGIQAARQTGATVFKIEKF